MMKVSKFMKMLSIVLMVLITFQSLPVDALIDPYISSTSNSSLQDSPTVDAYIIGEDENKRTATEKHFRMSDGSYTVYTYDKNVHYKNDDGKWDDIDNTLCADSKDGVEGYSNKKNSTKIKFAKKSNQGYLYEIKEGDYKITMGISKDTSPEKVSAEVVSLDNGNSSALETFDKKAVLNNITSKIRYENIFAGVDLEYTISGDSLNKFIIINEKCDTYSYKFDLELKNLSPKLEEDGSIVLYHSENAGEPVYVIPAPYMFDSAEVYSDDVHYTLTQKNKNKYTLEITADEDWLNSSERVYPITIDPPVYKYKYNGTYDAYVEAGNPDINHGAERVIYVGKNKNGPCYSLLKYSRDFLPVLSPSSIIVDASVSLHQLQTNGILPDTSTVTVGAYEVLSDWQEYQVTLNTAPEFNEEKVLDYSVVSSSTAGKYHTWNITDLVKRWYASDTIYGIALVDIAKTGYTYPSARFHTTEYYNVYDESAPVFQMNYRDNKGLESYWTTHSMNVFGAGTVYCNDFSGNVTYTLPLVSTPGNIMPLTVGLVYDGYSAGKYFTSSNEILTADYTAMQIGAGFKLNIMESVVVKVIDEGNGDITYLVHNDADGTEHYYYKPDGESKYVSEDGLPYEIKVTGTVGSSTCTYTMTDNNGNSKIFNAAGYMTEMRDVNGNKIAFGYDSGGKLYTICTYSAQNNDDINFVYFSYYGDTLIGITQGNTRCDFTYSENTDGTPNTLQSVEISKNNVTDGIIDTIEFSYNTDKQLTTVRNVDSNYSVRVSYEDGVCKELSERTPLIGQSIRMNRETDKVTKFTMGGKDDVIGTSDDLLDIYVFDYFGRTICTYTTDVNEQTVYSASSVGYNSEVNTKKNNKINKSGSSGMLSRNMLKYSSFEAGASTLNGYWSRTLSSNHSFAFDTAERYLGAKSAKLTASGNGVSSVYTSSTLTPGQTYTLSAYVKTSNVTGDGAYLTVTGTDTNASSLKVTSTDNEFENDWKRLSVSFVANSSDCTVSLVLSASSGTVYFDAVQLEEGQIGTYNLIENSDFSFGTHGWTLPAGASVNADAGLHGNCMEIVGSTPSNLEVTQTIDLNCSVNTTFILSAWMKGDSIDTFAHDDRTFEVKAEFVYLTENGTQYSDTYTVHAKANSNNSAKQFTSEAAVTPKDIAEACTVIDYVKISLSYNKNANEAYFDDISLIAEPAATYNYDDEGNISTVQSPDGNTPIYEYASNNVDLTSVTNPDGSSYTIEYVQKNGESTHQVSSITDANNVSVNYTYDRYGNITGVDVAHSNSDILITTDYTYDSTGRFVTGITDALGNTTQYNYNTANGLLNYVIDANNTKTSYLYDISDRITNVFTDLDLDNVIDDNESSVSYEYDSLDRLSKIISKNTTYNFAYDLFGNVKTITVGESETPLVSYVYGLRNGKQKRQTYANGDYIAYEYDVLDRVEKLCYNDNVRYVITYAKDGTVSQIEDLSENITYKYEYDRLGRLLTYHEIRNGQIITSFTNHYDSVGRNDKFAYKNEGYSERTYENTYSNTGYLLQTEFAGNYVYVSKGLYYRDLYHIHKYNGQHRYNVNFNYKFFTNADGESRSANQITKLYYSGTGINLEYNYEYDSLGNISNASGVTYAYDALNQLIRENNPDTSKTYVYSYDTAGNILSAKTYAYTTGALGTPLSEEVYAYTDANWGDKLTSYNGVSFTYDAQGNPLTYYNGENYTFTWQNGRQLASASKGTTNVAYKYNSDGIRYEKTVNGVVHKYYLNGSTITAETIVDNGNVTYIEYFYDTLGAHSFSLNGTMYFYIKNLQGDVMHIATADNTIVASYTYDAWGNIESVTGTLADTVGSINPLRYRGYYYDAETGLYYVSSRYYDPEIGRWISPEPNVDYGEFDEGAGLLGYNIYAYCANNPVMFKDETGESITLACVLIFGGIGMLLGAGHGAASSYKKTGQVSWKSTLGWAFVGGIVGAAIGYGVGVAIGASGSYVAGSGGKALLKTIQKTKISNKGLSNWIKECFRYQGKIGNGGLSDAIRYELRYNKLVGGKSHIQKGIERVKGLKRIIDKGGLTSSELALAKKLLADLERALRGK